MPTSLASSSSLHLRNSAAKGSGISLRKIFGSTVSWFLKTIGLIPGMMGTVMPYARRRSTKEKYFSLSKNICVTRYSDPCLTFSFK